jgi:DNA-binding NarL/FixJ family response regulator
MESPIRIFLLVDSRLLREALGRILKRRTDVLIAGEAARSPDAGAQIIHSACDVLLIDPMSTPPLDLQFLSDLHHSVPRLRVVMVGMDDNESVFLGAVRAGVSGYLLKDASAGEVLTAIRSVAQGEAVCPPRLCMALCNVVARTASFRPDVTLTLNLGLTRRQKDLIPLIAQGLTNKEIACRLNLSEQTIKNHVHRMLRKVGVRDRMGVVEKVRIESMVV